MAKSKGAKAPKTGPHTTRTGTTGAVAPKRERIKVMGPTGKLRLAWRDKETR